MKVEFNDEALRELYVTGHTDDRRYRKIYRDKNLLKGYQRAVKAMQDEPNTESLKLRSFLHYEKLKYEYFGFSSVRLVKGKIERLIFTEHEEGIRVELIKIDDTHYGNRK